jgi:hypothetical protein
MEPVADRIQFDLPGALVDDLLKKCNYISAGLYNDFNEILHKKKKFREQLKDRGLLHVDVDLQAPKMNPTSCGVDGAYARQRLISTDIAAVAAVAVEGLPPPVGRKLWSDPRHLSDIRAVPHSGTTGRILRALMVSMELDLADTASHNVVMLDGSLTRPMLSIVQAYRVLEFAPSLLVDLFESQVRSSVKIVDKTFRSPQSDQVYVFVPKDTNRKSLSTNLLGLDDFEDRGFLSFVLEEGEYVGPCNNQITSNPGYLDKLVGPGYLKRYRSLFTATDIIYYKPYEFTPVFRFEVSNSVSRSEERLAMLLEAIRIQCKAPSIYEPYPLYIANNMLKHLGSVIPALRNTTTNYIAERWEGSIHLPYMAMHGYRTETG